MSKTRSARRKPRRKQVEPDASRPKARRRSLLWIAVCGACVGLGAVALLWVRHSTASTAATRLSSTASSSLKLQAARADESPSDAETPAPAPADSAATPAPPQVPYYRYKIVKTYPHDVNNFTQGLVYHDGFLYEGTGLYGQSILIKRDLETADVIKQTRLPDRYFGEGITLLGDKIVQLTWRSRVGFSYDKETFRQIETFSYDSQGWGLTHDGKRLILSDGTATIHFLDPNTYAEIGRIQVRDQRRPIRQVNELEFIDGQIYANIWPTDFIAIISPQSGRITGWIDLTGLHIPPPNDNNNIVANGIAYLPDSKHLLVTGKRWPNMFEIELVPQTDTPGTP